MGKPGWSGRQLKLSKPNQSLGDHWMGKWQREIGVRGELSRRRCQEKAGGYRGHWSAQGFRENWFIRQPATSTIHRGGDNKVSEITLRMNELFIHQLHLKKKKRMNSDNSYTKVKNLQATCFDFLKSQVPGWALDKGLNGTQTSMKNLTVIANACFCWLINQHRDKEALQFKS